MKRSLPFILLIILLVSCNQSFYNTKQHAHRNFIKIGPGVEKENLQVGKEENAIEKINVQSSIQPTKRVFIQSKNEANNLDQANVPEHVKLKRNGTFTKTKIPVKNKKKALRSQVNKEKQTNETPILNIFSFIFGLAGVLLTFITLFILLFAIAFPYLGPIGVTLLIVAMGLGGLGIILGILGLSLHHPKKGLGIAGIIMGGVAIFLALIALLLYFIFL